MKKLLTLILIFLCLFKLLGQNKKDSKETEFKFKESKNMASFVCNHVLEKTKPILYVTHDSEGDWQFLCGEDDHTEENIKIISLLQAVELDNSINDLHEMPINVGAKRQKITEKWKPFKISN